MLHDAPVQAGPPHCISVRTVERELLLRCSSEAEVQLWRQAILSSSSSLPKSIEAFRGTAHAALDFSDISFPKRTTDSLVAEDGDATEPDALAHRFMTDFSLPQSSATSISGGGGAIPGWDGKKNSIGCVLHCWQ